jgi:hypothetical protein
MDLHCFSTPEYEQEGFVVFATILTAAVMKSSLLCDIMSCSWLTFKGIHSIIAQKIDLFKEVLECHLSVYTQMGARSICPMLPPEQLNEFFYIEYSRVYRSEFG